MESTIILQNVKKAFDGRQVIDKMCLTVCENEVVALIGPSGAGKTTLLRLIAGLEQPDGGTIKVNGTIGMVFQNGNLWPHKTLMGNIVEPLMKVKKMGRQAAYEKAMELLKKFGLVHLAEAYPETLSGGEAQRAAIARTLAMEPDVILLDEITSALDPVLVGEVMDTIRKLAQEKRTLVIVTHRMDFAKELADKVVFLRDGKIVEQGHPYAIFVNQENERMDCTP